jgi:hypothetical protein
MEVAGDERTQWESLTVSDGYGDQSQLVDYCTRNALWYHTGKQPVAIRWVIVRLYGKLTGLVSNDETLTADQMISYFVRRWSIETTFALVRGS